MKPCPAQTIPSYNKTEARVSELTAYILHNQPLRFGTLRVLLCLAIFIACSTAIFLVSIALIQGNAEWQNRILLCACAALFLSIPACLWAQPIEFAKRNSGGWPTLYISRLGLGSLHYSFKRWNEAETNKLYRDDVQPGQHIAISITPWRFFGQAFNRPDYGNNERPMFTVADAELKLENPETSRFLLEDREGQRLWFRTEEILDILKPLRGNGVYTTPLLTEVLLQQEKRTNSSVVSTSN